MPHLPGKTGFCRHCPARRGGSAQGTVGKRSLELLRVESVRQRRAAGGKWPELPAAQEVPPPPDTPAASGIAAVSRAKTDGEFLPDTGTCLSCRSHPGLPASGSASVLHADPHPDQGQLSGDAAEEGCGRSDFLITCLGMLLISSAFHPCPLGSACLLLASVFHFPL